MKTLNIIGCGKVGMVLGRLFHEGRIFRIGEILNRSLESGQRAAAFIGEGHPVAGFDQMGPADLWLIAASDDAITACADGLAASAVVQPGTVVWHLSGALTAAVLAPVQKKGAQTASVHPVKSFADAALSVREFPGTWCGLEGDEGAVAVLSAALTSLGANLFAVDPAFKTIYHAGSVIVCNYLTALLEVGLRSYEKAGLPRETATQVMEPLVRGTLENVFGLGTGQALTGPIARGDAAVVEQQLAALESWDGEVALLYRTLGRVALDLARRRAGNSPAMDTLQELLAEKTSG
ncbi:MAG TPA: DUF2520 domain-containing protein [Geomonas sp.]|nr:DUF2520 domain-containing protein [Geomonas sp.]